MSLPCAGYGFGTAWWAAALGARGSKLMWKQVQLSTCPPPLMQWSIGALFTAATAASRTSIQKQSTFMCHL